MRESIVNCKTWMKMKIKMPDSITELKILFACFLRYFKDRHWKKCGMIKKKCQRFILNFRSALDCFYFRVLTLSRLDQCISTLKTGGRKSFAFHILLVVRHSTSLQNLFARMFWMVFLRKSLSLQPHILTWN